MRGRGVSAPRAQAYRPDPSLGRHPLPGESQALGPAIRVNRHVAVVGSWSTLAPMSPTEIASLARQLARVRRALEAEAPFGPAWTATQEWVDELEQRVRAMGLNPDALVENAAWYSALPRRGLTG
jgi:hypothetical protein